MTHEIIRIGLEVVRTALEILAAVLLVICFAKYENKFIDFEDRLRIRIAKKLRSSERFMNWLYEPSISEQVEAEYCAGKVKMRNDWRSERHG